MNAPAIIQAARLPQAKCVYMLTDGARVKIGTTTNLDKRISALSGACGVKLEVIRLIEHAGPRVERWLHRRFNDLRGHGEWFSYSPEMLTVQPPEEMDSIPVVTKRRDIRLTLKERIAKTESDAAYLGVPASQRLLLMATHMSDDEADQVIELIREFVERRNSKAHSA